MKKEKKETMTSLVSNAACIPTLALCLVFAYFFYLRVGEGAFKGKDNIVTIIVALLCIPSIPLHELLHAIGWNLATGKKADVSYGYKFPTTAFISFKGTMTTEQFMFGVIFPMMVTGIIPITIGLITGNFYIFLYGITLFPGCGSDALSFIRCFKYLGRRVADTEGEIGFKVLAQ